MKLERNQVALNNVPKQLHIKNQLDKTQENNKCKVCRNQDEKIKQIISEYGKLVLNEYKNKHD